MPAAKGIRRNDARPSSHNALLRIDNMLRNGCIHHLQISIGVQSLSAHCSCLGSHRGLISANWLRMRARVAAGRRRRADAGGSRNVARHFIIETTV